MENRRGISTEVSGVSDLEACKMRYASIASELAREGLINHELIKFREECCVETATGFLVSEGAYLPTGFALGGPMPIAFSRELSAAAGKVAQSVRSTMNADFAFVPQEYYHVTIVNYTHFSVSREIRKLSPDEFEQAGDIISQLNLNNITVDFKGLLLTASGRLVVPGYPVDDRFFRLRNALAENIPPLRTHLPATVHIKLGHILPIPERNLRLAPYWPEILSPGLDISRTIDFKSVFSQIKIINL